MALLHEHLYRSEDVARLDFSEYVGSLAEQLISVYGASHQVRLEADMEPLYFDMDTAIPCGLIVNELLSNALKYGFHEGRSGVVRLQLRRITDDSVRLAVADDGIGLPDDFSWDESRSLGLRLVRALAEQLSGSVELARSPGTTFVITFPIPQSSKGEAPYAGQNSDR